MSEPAPLDFARRVLAWQGAVVAEDDRARAIEALIPEPLSVELGFEEHVLLHAETGRGGIPCGYGTEALTRLASFAIGQGRVAAFNVDVAPPIPRCPDPIQGLNVSLKTIGVASEPGWILLGIARYAAQSDDERTGVVQAAVDSGSGAVVHLPPLGSLDGKLARLATEEIEAAAVQRALPRLEEALRASVAVDVASFREAVAKRRARDRARLERYFRDMKWDAMRRLRGRGGEALRAKLDAIPAELARRLADLEERTVLHVKIDVIALVALAANGLSAGIEARRRKLTRTFEVRYDGLTRAWLGLPCSGCAGTTAAIALCDQGSHVLCARCWAACGDGGHRPCFLCEGKPSSAP